MSPSDDEDQLRVRVERTVAAMPGPELARLTAIRDRLPHSASRRRTTAWLAVALGLGLGAAATAAWFAGPGAAGSGEAPGGTSQQGGPTGDGDSPGSGPEAAREDAEDGEDGEAADSTAGSDDSVIYRE